MRCLRYLSLPSLLWILLGSTSAAAAPWKEDPAFFNENANAQSAKVDAADLNDDGFIDLVFANTKGSTKGAPDALEGQQAFQNVDNAGLLTDVSVTIFGGTTYTGRAVKLRDVDYDGDVDIVLGTTWFTPSKLFLNNGSGDFTFTQGTLPPDIHNVGDVEVGDIDLDGDLDIVAANWGDDPVADGEANGPEAGGAVLFWTQDGEPGEFAGTGSGTFSDDAPFQPNQQIRFSWDLDFIDFDNDYDLDLVIATQHPDRSLFLYRNDAGKFSIAAIDNVQGRSAVEVEPWDLNGDTFLDILTLQDGQGRRNRVLTNNAGNGFVVEQNTWPMLENPPSLDFGAAFIDHDADADADLLLGAFQNINKYPDRLMLNEAGIFKQYDSGLPEPLRYQALEHVPNPTDASIGTYSLVLAHLDGDAKIDVVMSQYDNATAKKVFRADLDADIVKDDTRGPVFVNHEKLSNPYPHDQPFTLRARVHDNKSPLQLHDFEEDTGFPYIESWNEQPNDPDATPGTLSDPGQWYGEYLWRINFKFPSEGLLWWRLCAIDRFGNKSCTTLEGPLECADCMPVDPTTTTTDPTTTTSDETTVNTLGNDDSGSGTEPTTEPVPTTAYDPTVISSGADDDSASETITTGFLDDDGCGCSASDAPARDIAASLALLALLGLRRRRR